MRTVLSILLIAICFSLAACESSVNFDATANVSAQYSSVFVTVKEVWVNESATATPDDTTWLKFPLSKPVTFDLVGLNSGALSDFASQLAITTGTYRQMRLILVDRSEALTDSAKSVSATYNDQVTWFDASGTQGTLPLEIPNSAQGIGIEMELVVPAPTEAILAALASTSSSSSSTDSTSSTTSTIPTTTTTTSTTALSSDSTTSTVTATSRVMFDAARDLTAFRFSDRPGFLLNPTLSARDQDDVGTIQGQLDLSLLTINTGTGRPDIEVTAEALNDDSTRRIEIGSAPVSVTGTFTLYPLPLIDGKRDSTTYDLVIHGPGVRTIVIRSVPVTKGTPDDGADVALGTITLTAADSYAVNVDASSVVATRGARVAFYQTLPDDNAPYLIEQRPVDPLSGQFANDGLLSGASTIVFGTFGSSIAFTAAAPQEGASKYSVSTLSPLFEAGDFSLTLLAPPAATTSTATFTVPDVSLPSGAASGTIAATVSVGTQGKYDKGALLVTHNVAVVTATSLDQAITTGAASTIVNATNVPASSSAGFDRGLYYLEAWAWNSADPAGTFSRQPVTGAVDLRATLTANANVTLN